MTAPEIIKDLKARKFKPLYLLHGEEPYFIDLVSNYIEHKVLSDAEKGFNQTVLYGKDTDIMTAINAAKRYPMMSDYQVVMIKEAQDMKWGRMMKTKSTSTRSSPTWKTRCPAPSWCFATNTASLISAKKPIKP
jgi:DNA polymerase III delta subunit